MMINGDAVRLIPEKNRFIVYRMGSHSIQVFYRKASNMPPRILDLPKCLVECIVDDYKTIDVDAKDVPTITADVVCYQPSMKEIRTRVMKHSREDGKGWTYKRVREELINEHDGGVCDPKS